MSYTRPTALLDAPSWAGSSAYVRPTALADSPSFASEAVQEYSRPNALLDAPSWAGDDPYSRPNPLTDVVVFDAGGSPVDPVGPVSLFWSGALPVLPSLMTAFFEHESTLGLGDANVTYVMDVTGPTGTVRVPISSWQATLQTGRSNYVQAVVPAVLPHVETLKAGTSFQVLRRTVLGDVGVEREMASAPLQVLRFERGAGRYTATISGYSPGFPVPEEAPPDVTELRLVRGVSLTNGLYRIRCGIDWVLRPGMRAAYAGESFVVGYINYYVGGGDAYMDVGERL